MSLRGSGALVVVLWLCVAMHSSHAQLMGDNVAYRPGQCLPGGKHKEAASPAPEGPDYVTCHQWRDNACCSAEFTQTLQHANVTNIDGFHWNRCGDLSVSCQRFFVEIECFYRCSPHVAHWQNIYPSSLANLPVCREFCDAWFEACADDMTCVKNWITDWNNVDGQNLCPNNPPVCKTYRDLYSDGAGICGQLWGQSFFRSNYSQLDPDRQCMIISWDDSHRSPNMAALANMFQEADSDCNGERSAAVAHTLVMTASILGLALL